MKLSQDFNLQQVYMLSRIFTECIVTITVYDVRRREESYITLVLGLITLHLKKQTRMRFRIWAQFIWRSGFFHARIRYMCTECQFKV